MKPKSKKRIAMVSLTDDEGCYFAILDLGEKFFKLFDYVDIAEFRLIEGEREEGEYDIAFLEGSVITEENVKLVKKLRKKSKILVGLGACAVTGGIPELKNNLDKDKLICRVYSRCKGIENPEIKPISHYVKVDFEIPGCPVDKDEFLKYLYFLKEGIIPKIPMRPVCFECQLKENKCLLLEGKPCIGPVILGGCKAVCPSNNFPCDGCRGVIPGSNFTKMQQVLEEIVGKEKSKNIFERYGNLDSIKESIASKDLMNKHKADKPISAKGSVGRQKSNEDKNR